jgi:dTDP-4-dehydrorhamnose reductase
MMTSSPVTQRILLIGKNGQLGWELQRTLPALGELTAVDWPEIDLNQPEMIRELVRTVRPQVILNAAAYTAVDKAETEVELCRAINATAPAILAEEALALNAGLIHYSTDYVFDGAKGSAYIETDTPHPLNQYGRNKLEGEQAIEQAGGAFWILRTSWVYSLRRDSFVTKVLEWSRRQKTMKVVSDQYGCPTWCRLLAEITSLALAQGRQDPVEWIRQTSGLYHLAGDGAANRYEWAQEILKLDPKPDEQMVETLAACATAEFPTPAQRPLFVPMDCGKFMQTFHLRLPPWQQGLKLLMA